MAVITIIALIVFFFAYLWDSSKKSNWTRESKKMAERLGDCAYWTSDNKMIHIPTGKRCREWLKFDNKHYAYHYYTNFRTGEILGGQYSDNPKKMLSVKEVQDLLKEEELRQENRRIETESRFYRDHPEYAKGK